MANSEVDDIILSLTLLCEDEIHKKVFANFLKLHVRVNIVLFGLTTVD